MPGRPIYVTRPQLPPLAEFVRELEQIWESRFLTNCGPYHERLEAALGQMLGVPYVSLFSNGTIGLITALQSLRVNGEVITTPYSFVATAHAIRWAGAEPVFVDIDSRTLNIDPSRIEAAITPRTSAILPVHCYGHPCDVAAIGEIAARRGLRVVYDAAHAFGVECDRGSILNHGDLSVLSFHATKVFNTFEGGAIVSQDAATKARIDQLRNFGIVDEVSIAETGINGKMSEINAACGLIQLRHHESAIEGRRRVDRIYRQRLGSIRGITCLEGAGERKPNFAYFPILIGDEFPLSRDALHRRFYDRQIYVRRYFYPLISDYTAYSDSPSATGSNLRCAADAAHRVLCLPIYPDIPDEDIEAVLAIIEGATA
jgi:dTDP-4-amino-4,6-dideoxygalactose transaminase